MKPESFRLRTSRLCAALLVATTTAAAPALAADAAPAKPAAQPQGKVMTRDELRACLDERDQIQAQRARIQKENAALAQQRTDFSQREAELTQRRTAQDPADAAAAQALQTDIAEHDRRVDEFNAQLKTLRDNNQALETQRVAYVQRCETRPYDERDEAAIIRDRRNAAAAAAKAKK
jgi:chromosome segregation ATPase